MVIKRSYWIGSLMTLSLFLGTMAFNPSKESKMTSMEPANAQSLEEGTIIEVATFSLKAGVTPDDFYIVDQAVELQHVSQQPGFISRESAVNDGNEWLVIVRWRSIEDAEASMTSFSSAPATAEFMSMLEMDTMSMKRYTTYGLHNMESLGPKETVFALFSSFNTGD